MVQRQLPLLVLGIVLVRLAVVVGISASSENQKKSTLDLMTSDAVRLATAVQACKLEPNAVGASDVTFARATFQRFGFQPQSGTGADATYATASETFRIKPFTGPIAALALQMFGIANTGDAAAVVGLSPDRRQSVLIAICMADPTKTVTFLQHPFNVSVYGT